MKKQAQKVVSTLVSPIESFLALESASGILLLLMTVLALGWANSPWHESYHSFIHLPLGLKMGAFYIEKSLAHWVNDGLMVIFFFVVGLEIKSELIRGELSSPRKAALPMFAAVGGMVVPAAIYAYFNHDSIGVHGWGIPMATDIAFAVGVLTLLGKRVPFSLKVFLLALAIVDDLGAVLVIAFFYTSDISKEALGASGIIFAIVTLLRYSGVRSLLVYSILGVGAWFAVLQSGVHATIAGVILGLMTPLEAYRPKESIAEKMTQFARDLTNIISRSNGPGWDKPTLKKLDDVSKTINESKSPLERIIYFLHPWVSYTIMPAFALVNAGVHLDLSSLQEIFQSPITLGIIFGLFVGKPAGVLLFSWLSCILKIAELPKGVTWTHMTGAGFIAGIGFTMALFISNLALSPELETYSKVGILSASLLAAVFGVMVFMFLPKVSSSDQMPEEKSTK